MNPYLVAGLSAYSTASVILAIRCAWVAYQEDKMAPVSAILVSALLFWPLIALCYGVYWMVTGMEMRPK